MNDDFLNMLFDELRLSKAQISTLYTTIETMKQEQLELKETVRHLQHQALSPTQSLKTAPVHLPLTLKLLAFGSFNTEKFPIAVEQFIQNYASHITTLTYLNVHKKMLTPVMIVPKLPNNIDADPWKENKRKELYQNIQNDFITAYKHPVSFGKAYTYVTAEKTYRTAYEFIVDIAVRVNIVLKDIDVVPFIYQRSEHGFWKTKMCAIELCLCRRCMAHRCCTTKK